MIHEEHEGHEDTRRKARVSADGRRWAQMKFTMNQVRTSLFYAILNFFLFSRVFSIAGDC